MSARWHWTGHAAIATVAGCALVEHYSGTATVISGRIVSTRSYTVDVVRGRARETIIEPTSRKARARAEAAAKRLDGGQ